MGIIMMKLTFLFLKYTAVKGSKPFMNFVLARAKNHQYFVDTVLVPIANFQNNLESKLKMWILNKWGAPAKIEVLNREQSVKLATYMIAELTGESIAIYFILSTYWYSRAKALKKEEDEISEIEDLWKKVEELKNLKMKQINSIKELLLTVEAMNLKS
ncbi:hypothetical protein WA026_006178 [Henosepilachna vigintioctopunctata]|uniref:Uncharacterized protein n=1 Tax=Henosepilachna vigintioctopunctata TaxID=420089 RepID=A0AAW1TK17_9CUCU